MNELKIFEKEEFGPVRVVMKDGEPWFVAKDVCDCLELGNPRTSIALLDDDEKGVHTVDTPGGSQEMSVISEAGLYSLILRSRKPEAKEFKRWVTHEVLPSIRKTGQYGGYTLPRVPQSFPDALRMIADIEEEKALAIEQRDYYKRTKAEIGSRREATAMATASAAVRKANMLEDELGRGKRYKAVKAIPWLFDEFKASRGMYSVVGKALKRVSADLGYSVEKIATPEFPDGINAYHVDVIAAFRSELTQNPGMLDRYRRRNAA